MTADQDAELTSVPLSVRMKASRSRLADDGRDQGVDDAVNEGAGTMFLKAAPMMTLTASSTTLPRDEASQPGSWVLPGEWSKGLVV